MNQLTLSTLLNQIGSDKVTGFFLVLARVSPLFVLAPLFSSKMVPARVKGVVAVGLSIGLTPLAVHGRTYDPAALKTAMDIASQKTDTDSPLDVLPTVAGFSLN